MARWQAREHEKRIEAIRFVLVTKYKAIVAATDAGILRKYAATIRAANRGRVNVPDRDSGIPVNWPDLVALLQDGRTLLIEVKTGDADLTAGQRRMREQIEKRGHEYVLARNVDAVNAAVERKT